MSLKPVKRGDQTRPWMKRRQAPPRHVLPERHLFVTEGTKTEPNYLNGLIEALVRRLGEPARKQFQVCGEGCNTLALLERAEAHLNNDANGFQHIWIIYDQDDFPADRFDNVVSRCTALSARSPGQTWHAIWSNQCFELWFLLHFSLMQSDLRRDEYGPKLTELLQEHGICRKYEKNCNVLFDKLLPYLPNAIRNAEMLMKHYSSETPPSARAPATAVYELLRHFQSYLLSKG